MGILEFILALILFTIVADVVFSFIPIPRNILGTIAAVIILYYLWILLF